MGGLGGKNNMDMKRVERVREQFLAFESFLVTGFSP